MKQRERRGMHYLCSPRWHISEIATSSKIWLTSLFLPEKLPSLLQYSAQQQASSFSTLTVRAVLAVKFYQLKHHVEKPKINMNEVMNSYTTYQI